MLDSGPQRTAQDSDSVTVKRHQYWEFGCNRVNIGPSKYHDGSIATLSIPLVHSLYKYVVQINSTSVNLIFSLRDTAVSKTAIDRLTEIVAIAT